METQTIAQRLALAESRVQQGDVWLSRQRTLVRHLERHGLGTFYARRLLADLEAAQADAVAYRDQLESEMFLLAPGPAGSRVGEEVPASSTAAEPFFSGQETISPRQA